MTTISCVFLFWINWRLNTCYWLSERSKNAKRFLKLVAVILFCFFFWFNFLFSKNLIFFQVVLYANRIFCFGPIRLFFFGPIGV